MSEGRSSETGSGSKMTPGRVEYQKSWQGEFLASKNTFCSYVLELFAGRTAPYQEVGGLRCRAGHQLHNSGAARTGHPGLQDWGARRCHFSEPTAACTKRQNSTGVAARCGVTSLYFSICNV